MPFIPAGVSGKRIAIVTVWATALFVAFGCFLTAAGREWWPRAGDDTLAASTGSLLWIGGAATLLVVGAMIVGRLIGMFRWDRTRVIDFLIELGIGMAGFYLLLRMGCFGT